MIVAIADDFTGAAELGGIGLRYGLDVEIHTSVPKYTKAELLIIATDTRSKSPGEAAKTLDEVLQDLSINDLRDLFKKTDSVLRGHVITEIETIRRHFDEEKVLLVPCNPSLNRIISKGTYYVDGEPIHQTHFADEYEERPESSHILELLDMEPVKSEVFILRTDQPFASRKYVIGEAQTVEQMEEWAENGIMDQRVLAGGADFFSAFLHKRGYSLRTGPSSFTLNFPVGTPKKLYVSGSASKVSHGFVEQAQEQGQAVCPMPDRLFEAARNGNSIDQDLTLEWAGEIKKAFEENHRVIVAIHKPLVKQTGLGERLSTCLANVMADVLNDVDIWELFIEGGATAGAILNRMEYSKLLPAQELAPGVIRMQVAGQPKLNVTLKPGSYDWPENIWNRLTQR